MAIETRIINGSFTELYTGGGNYMTQAKATHFHSFWTRKILAPTESIDDFKEVTASEKAKLEAADAAWERPPQSFIDAWNTRADFTSMNKSYKFGQYNEDTGYFELNKILDIEYPEAREIMVQSGNKVDGDNAFCNLTPVGNVRTLMPIRYGTTTNRSMLSYANVKIYQVLGHYGTTINFNGGACFYACDKLREVLGVMAIRTNTNFTATRSIEKVNVISNFTDNLTLTLSSCPLLSLESINYTIENSTKSLTLILHPDAYARVTNEMFEKAAAKNITITSA